MQVRKEQLDEIRRLLRSDKPDLNIILDKANGETPLYIAIRAGDIDLADDLIKAGANLNVFNVNGLSPIGLTCEIDQPHILASLLDAGAKPVVNNQNKTLLHLACEFGTSDEVKVTLEDVGVDVNSTDLDGNAPLHIACENGNSEATAELILAGAKLNEANNKGDTPLKLALDQADAKSAAYVLGKLLGEGMDVNTKLNDSNETPLHIAVKIGNKKLVQYLIGNGANVLAKTTAGVTPLEYAVMGEQSTCTKLLLKTNQYDLDTLVTDRGDSLLHEAASQHSTTIFKYLLDAGANPFTPNQDDITPYDIVLAADDAATASHIFNFMSDAELDDPINQNSETVLTVAIALEATSIAEAALLRGADPNIDLNGQTPLIRAIELNNEELVKLLLTHGVNINGQNANGTSALHRAVQRSDDNIAALLLAADANVNIANDAGKTPLHYAVDADATDAISLLLLTKDINLNALDNNGNTPLHLAFINQNTTALQMLLDAGANINVADKNGDTLLHLATKAGLVALVERLVKAGADIHAKNKNGDSPLQLASQAHFPAVSTIFLHKGNTAPETIYDIATYVDYTLGHKSIKIDDQQAFDARKSRFQNIFTDQLIDASSELAKAIRSLPYQDKVNLLAALIGNDTKYLKNLFATTPFKEFLQKNGFDFEDVKFITLHDDPKTAMLHEQWLSNATSRVIACLFTEENGNAYSSHKQEQLVSEALALIPDGKIAIPAKFILANSISPEFNEIKVAYNEFLRPQQESKSSGCIELDQYRNALALGEQKVSQSDFIILTMGALQQHADSNTEIAAELKSVRQHYALTSYSDAVAELRELAIAFKDAIGNDLSSVIQSNAGKFTGVEDDNYSRRFFENKAASTLQASAVNLDAANKVLAHYGFTPANNATEMIVQVSLLLEADIPEQIKRMKGIRRDTGFFSEERRIARPGFISKTNEAKDDGLGESIYSSNKGVMMSNQPNYYDEISQNPLRNSPADIYRQNTSYQFYQAFRKGSFAGGVSSHAAFAVALLEKYASDNQQSKTLEADVNHFIQAVISTNISRGYHGALEIQALFDNHTVRDLFNKKYGINISTQMSDDVLETACRESQTYAATLCNRMAMNASIQHAPDLSEILNNCNAALLSQMISRNEVDSTKPDKDGSTLLHSLLKHNFTEDQVSSLLVKMQEQGIDVNALNGADESPLLLAVKNGYYHVAKTLLANGAANSINNYSKDEQTPLLVAINNGNFALAHLLLNNGALPDIRNDKFETLLHVAATAGDTRLLGFMIEHGAEINATNNSGTPPLLMAAENEKWNVVKILLDNENTEVKEQNDHPVKLLHLAIAAGKTDIAMKAIERGADINQKNEQGLTPLDIARQMNNREMTNMLSGLGAKESASKADVSAATHLRRSHSGVFARPQAEPVKSTPQIENDGSKNLKK